MSEVERCIDQCCACAGLFRLGRSVEAALDMLDVFEAAASHLDGRSQLVAQEWLRLLTLMLNCQQSRDWLGLADYMEYELAALLRG
jgi:hypothetical protein